MANDTFRAVFLTIWVFFWSPKCGKTSKKCKMTNRPCYTPDVWVVNFVHTPECTTASQAAIASDFLNCRRNRKDFPQREANLHGHFSSQNASLVAQTLHQGCRATAVPLHLCLWPCVFAMSHYCRATPLKGSKKGHYSSRFCSFWGGGV